MNRRRTVTKATRARRGGGAMSMSLSQTAVLVLDLCACDVEGDGWVGHEQGNMTCAGNRRTSLIILSLLNPTQSYLLVCSLCCSIFSSSGVFPLPALLLCRSVYCIGKPMALFGQAYQPWICGTSILQVLTNSHL